MSELPSIVEFSTNLKDAEAPEPLPVGEYTGVIMNAEQRESQRGTRYAAVTFQISPDQYPADYTDGNPDGTTIIYRRVSLEDTPQGRFGARKFCEAIGAPLSKSIDLTTWLGSEAIVEVDNEVYEDVPRPVISKVRAAG